MSGFFEELKRRKVIRAGVIYGAACFAILEGADIILSNLGLSASLMRFLVLLAILGFPLAVVLSWYYELTPDGVKRAGGADTHSATPWLSPAAGLFTALFLVIGAGAWWLSANLDTPAELPGPTAAVQAASIAVLPFANLSADPENEYFSDGLAEELLNVLARVPGLKVAGRTSSFAFKGRSDDAREIARALSVANVLEGSVRKSADRVRISVQLVQAEDGFQLWSDSFDRELDDIFAVQEEIATSIVEALEVTLVGGVTDPIVEPTTTNQMAYDKYLWGRYNLAKRTEEGIYEAIENFNGSIMMDSMYAPSFAGLADAYMLLPLYSADVARAPGEVHSTSLEMAERAVELDPDLAEAHASLGAALTYTFDFERSLAEFDVAISLNPQYAPAHQWRSVPLTILGRYNEAIAAAQTAFSLDPLSISASLQLAQQLYLVGRPQDAIGYYERARSLSPENPKTLEDMALTFVALGSFDQAEEALGQWASEVGRDPGVFRTVIRQAAAYASRGAVGDASTAAAQEDRGPLMRARWYALVGQDETAVQHLQAAFDQQDRFLLWLPDPAFDHVRSDPRVQAVARELGVRW